MIKFEGVKEELLYRKLVFISFFNDFKSWSKIIYNGWPQRHMPIGYGLGIGILFLLNHFFVGLNDATKFMFASGATFIGCQLYEWGQQSGRIIEAKEKFESDKDVLAGWLPSLLGIGTCLYILNHYIN